MVAIEVTPTAREQVLKIMEKQGKPGSALRLYVQGGGCSGLTYGMTFDKQESGDEVAFQAQPDGSIRIERPQPDASPFARFRGAWRDKGITAAAIRAMRRPEMDIPPESDHS